MPSFTIASGTYAAGFPLGIIMMETHVPYPPGSPNNARTFDVPVVYEVVPGASMDALIYSPQVDLLRERFLEAGRRLVDKGVKAILGGCGFMVLFQEDLARALPVPVFSSSLIQLPQISAATGGRTVGIVTASAESLTQRHLDIATGGQDLALAVVGLEDGPAFSAAIHQQTGVLDTDAVESEVVAAALDLQARFPDLGAILLECTDLPPYAGAVHRETRLPVFDVFTLAQWAHHAIEPRNHLQASAS